MRICVGCGIKFDPSTKKGYRCSGCRRIYDRAWRERRAAAGLPVRGKPRPETIRKWRANYYAQPEVRRRRAAHQAEYRQSPELRPRHLARGEVKKALAKGKLVRQPCEVCGASKVDAHHNDYNRPLDVRWLCPTHHREHHAQARAEGRTL